MTLTGTNTWVIGSGRRVVVVDPGPAQADHVDALCNLPIDGILLAHRQGDHADAVGHLPDSIPIYAADPALARGTSPLTSGDLLHFGDFDVNEMARAKHPSNAGRQRASRWMLEIEWQHLRATGRIQA